MTAPLRGDRAFRLLWFGEGVSVVGSATSTILLPLLAVVRLHAGPGAMGLLAAAAWLPWLVVGVPVGVLVDRLSARGVMMTADLVSAAALLSIPAAAAADVLSMAQLLCVALVTGTCTVFFRAAYPALLRRIASSNHLTSANARMLGTEAAADVVGPSLGGWLAAVLGAATGVLADVASFVVSAVCLWRLPRHAPRVARSAEPSRPAVGSVVARAREGVRFVYADRLLRLFAVSGGISNFGLTGVNALLVLFLARTVGLHAATIGVLLALGSLGGVAGSTVAGRLCAALGSARAMRLLAVVGAPAPLLLPFVGPGATIVIVPLALAMLGCGLVGGNVVRGAFRMQYVPADMLGRATTATQLVNFGAMPLAGVCAGALGDAIGLRLTLLVMAAVHAAASLAVPCSHVRHWRELPAAPTRTDAQPVRLRSKDVVGRRTARTGRAQLGQRSGGPGRRMVARRRRRAVDRRRAGPAGHAGRLRRRGRARWPDGRERR
ncbi:MFS transporter [uncultured Jatrophihabitans sp.]|uniref:MFS transporter n=1 Tax=uncultured Jatrophihabitans sp. TaxID=1610747 RepID=UPI0035CBC94D